jgi:SAM-dependent methyltransferase
MDVDGYADPYLASLYEIECAWHPSDDFYLGLVRSSGDVLDVGCGTGAVLGAAAERGHAGRLVGVDPAEGMLVQARVREGVEWVRGLLPDQSWTAQFDLVTMTGHAFQELRSDEDVRDFLRAAHRVLRPGGRLAFETRNPLRRAWDSWTSAAVTEIVDAAGLTVRVRRKVVDVTGELITFTETYDADSWAEPLQTRSTLRFLPAERLDAFVREAGFTIDERYGDWDRRPFTADSPEIVTIASVS